jgi:hypothetical protein
MKLLAIMFLKVCSNFKSLRYDLNGRYFFSVPYFVFIAEFGFYRELLRLLGGAVIGKVMFVVNSPSYFLDAFLASSSLA